ncbi:MAG: hypothetical protein WC635_06060 [Bacteriovorax sp.]|jgi:hypothetical protein
MLLNRKKLLAACTLAVLSTVSFEALAASGASVCSDPIQRICKDTVDQRKEHEIYVAKLKSEISEDARLRSTPRIEEMKKKVKPYRFIKRFLEATKIRNQEIMASAKKRIGGFEEVITNAENVNKIKNYLSQAIDGSSFDLATKANFKGIVKSIVVGNFSDFLERTDLEDNVLAQFLGNACGSDGLVANAFATTLKGDRYVLICPGFLITVNQSANESEKFNSILQAISHEMGHHIDNSKVGNDLYAPYLGCLADNYSDRFNKTKEDEKFCKDNIKEASKCNRKVALSHAGELIADQWGIAVTAIHARTENFSVAEADQMLTDSWSKLCGTGDEGIHPTGDFRIGTLMRKNPGITNYLSCLSTETDAKPACTFAGASAN